LHEEIGAYVLEQWGMPVPTVEAARHHHRYLGPKAEPAHRLIHAANLICRQIGAGLEQVDVSFNLEHSFVDLGLSDRARVDAIVERTSTDLENLMAAFGQTAATP
jgi:HD-like signal output (HDOD) protein